MRVVIGEDSTLLREGLSRLLTEAGHEVVATAADLPGVEALLRSVPDLDVAVLDVRMPPTGTDEGARAALALRRERPDVGVLLLSEYVETTTAVTLMQQHPRGFGYLLKDRVVEVTELVDALERIAAGGFAVEPAVVAELIEAGRRGPVALLTPRELDILRLIAEGLSNRAVADHLAITTKTVENHVSRVFAKLGLGEDDDEHRRVRAAVMYLRRHLPGTAREH